MQVEYDYESVAQGCLDVSDIGNCFIVARSQEDVKMYFGTITKYGITKIIIFGPIVEDAQEMVTEYSFTVKKKDYNPYKIRTELEKMLNSSYKIKLIQAELIEEDEFRKAIPSFDNIFKKEENIDFE